MIQQYLQSPVFVGFLGGLVAAIITYVVAPWVKDRVEAGKEKREYRRGLLRMARESVSAAYDYAAEQSEPFEAHIQGSRGYLDIEASLPDAIREHIRSTKTQNVLVMQADSPAGVQGVARELLDEL